MLTWLAATLRRASRRQKETTMLSPEESQAWRERTAALIFPLDKAKIDIWERAEALERVFPAWAESMRSPDHFQRDARLSCLYMLANDVFNSQLTLLFIRDQLSDPAWWASNSANFSDAGVRLLLGEHLKMARIYSIHATSVTVEDTLRAILRSAPALFPGMTLQVNADKLYARCLAVSGQSSFLDLFEALRLTRNTFHNNGVFHPRDGKPVTLRYGGRTFAFVPGKQLDWVDDSLLSWFPEQLAAALELIVTSPAIAAIPHCPRI
jgi:hypothetical protein